MEACGLLWMEEEFVGGDKRMRLEEENGIGFMEKWKGGLEKRGLMWLRWCE